jgi:hypothetical protein
MERKFDKQTNPGRSQQFITLRCAACGAEARVRVGGDVNVAMTNMAHKIGCPAFAGALLGGRWFTRGWV